MKEVTGTLSDLEARLERMQAHIAKLRSLLDVGLYINTLDPDAIEKRVLEVSTSIVRAERGSLMLLDLETRSHLEFAVMVDAEDHPDAIRRMRIDVGQGIAGTVASTGRSLTINDTSKDERFFPGVDRASGFRTRSILAVPLRLGDEVIGVMEFLNKLPDGAPFDEEDMEICSAMANMVSVAIGNARSYKLAITDRLTELYNFGYFKEHLPREIQWAQRNHEELSLAILDVDHFKHFNDTNGHDSGNEALQKVARILKGTARVTDTVARYGGEEFVVVMPNTGPAGALHLAERLRQAVWEEEFAGGPTQHLGRVSISVGVATYPQDGTTDISLVHAADQHLYAAKSNGRNRVAGS